MIGRRRLVPIALVAVTLVVGACSGGPDPDASPQATAGTQTQDEEPSGGPTTTTPQPVPDEERVISVGAFERIGYDGEGEATVVDTGDGVEVRFSEFRVEQGPALRVYLSAARAGAADGAYDDDFVDLGALDAFRGDQRYVVPSDVDVDGFRSVVIWCAEFSVGFVVAPIGTT